MGYFPNGTSAEMYQELWCARCIHGPHQEDKPCAIWLLHFIRNYQDCNDPESALHVLIPMSENGLENQECAMFIEDKNLPDPRQGSFL